MKKCQDDVKTVCRDVIDTRQNDINVRINASKNLFSKVNTFLLTLDINQLGLSSKNWKTDISHIHSNRCRNDEKIECKENLKKECRTVYKNDCKPIKKKVCKTVYKEECVPAYKPSYGAPKKECKKVGVNNEKQNLFSIPLLSS